MNAIDWGIIVFYLAGMIGLSIWLGRRILSERDYYVVGHDLP